MLFFLETEKRETATMTIKVMMTELMIHIRRTMMKMTAAAKLMMKRN